MVFAMDPVGASRIYHSVITVEYDSEKVASSVLSAVDVDNKGYVEAQLKGNRLVFKCCTSRPGRLKNTIDDLLSCLGLAEKMLEL